MSLPNEPELDTSLAANPIELTEAESALLAAPGEGAAATPAPEGAPAATPGNVAAPAAAEGSAAAAAATPAPADGAGAGAAAVAEGGAAVAAPPAEAAPSGGAAPLQPFVPVLANTAKDYAAELAEVQAAKVALREKHRAGEIDDDAYDTQFDALQDRKSALVTGQALAEQRAELNTAFADQSWAYVQRQFLASPDNAALLQKPLLFSAWESAMQTVVNQAAEQKLQLSDWDIMAHARKMLADEGLLAAGTPAPAGGAQPAPGAATGAAGAGAAPPKPDRMAPFAQVPATLGNAPSTGFAGAAPGSDDLASLDIEELEARLAKASDHDIDALLRQTAGQFVDDK